jgi:hypothetical protein
MFRCLSIFNLFIRDSNLKLGFGAFDLFVDLLLQMNTIIH